jgi:mRNA interferase RelE/StbE
MRVELSRRAEKQFERLDRDPDLQSRIDEGLGEIESEPLVGKPLEGEMKGFRAHRIGEWRIIYEIDRQRNVSLVSRIAHRREVYK